jgi:hypothetical protein
MRRILVAIIVGLVVVVVAGLALGPASPAGAAAYKPEFKAFPEKTRPVYEKWTQEVGVELVRAAEKLVEASR